MPKPAAHTRTLSPFEVTSHSRSPRVDFRGRCGRAPAQTEALACSPREAIAWPARERGLAACVADGCPRAPGRDVGRRWDRAASRPAPPPRSASPGRCWPRAGDGPRRQAWRPRPPRRRVGGIGSRGPCQLEVAADFSSSRNNAQRSGTRRRPDDDAAGPADQARPTSADRQARRQGLCTSRIRLGYRPWQIAGQGRYPLTVRRQAPPSIPNVTAIRPPRPPGRRCSSVLLDQILGDQPEPDGRGGREEPLGCGAGDGDAGSGLSKPAVSVQSSRK